MPTFILFYHHYHTVSALKALIENLNLFAIEAKLITKIYFYGWNINDILQEKEICNLITSLFLPEQISLCFSKKSPKSENITLSLIKKTLQTASIDRGYVIYAHSKGASYSDPKGSMLVAQNLIETTIAFVKFFSQNPKELSDYNVFGARLSLGVFERYGYLKKAFSGNIWMARVEYIKNLRDFSSQELISSMDRHQAECWISSSPLIKPLNGLMGISSYELNRGGVRDLVLENIRMYSEMSKIQQLKVDDLLEKIIIGHLEQQLTYDNARFAWSFRKKIFGHNSVLTRRIGRVSEKIESWKRVGLYRHYFLPSHFDLVKYI